MSVGAGPSFFVGLLDKLKKLFANLMIYCVIGATKRKKHCFRKKKR